MNGKLISREEAGARKAKKAIIDGPLPVYGYVRYSTSLQSYFNSFDRQETAINLHCEAARLKLIRIYRDPETSGAKGDRPGMNALIEQLRITPGIVVVEGMDRWTRSAELWAELKGMLKLSGSTLHFCGVGELDEVDELDQVRQSVIERRHIRSRMYYAKCIHAPRGKNCGRVPYGYYSDKNRFLQVKEDEAEVIRFIYAQRMLSVPTSYRQIAARLTDRGIPTPDGKELWTGETVARLIGREQYIGVTRSVIPKPDWIE